jgi:hypothetical protein
MAFGPEHVSHSNRGGGPHIRLESGHCVYLIKRVNTGTAVYFFYS